MLLELLYFCFINITLILPGYVFIKKLGYFKKNPGIQLCLAYSISLFFFAILSTASYVLKINPLVSRYLTWFVILIALYIFIKDKLFKDFADKYRFPVMCFVAMTLFGLLFISLPFNASRNFVPDPKPEPGRNYSSFNVKVLNLAQTQANDNYIPYRQAQFFINRSDPAKDSFIGEWGVDFFVRTPLMGAVTANYINLFGEKPPIDYIWSATSKDPGHTYKKFQILAHVLNSLLIIPGFYLICVLFNKRTAYISLLFIIPSIFFVFNEFFSWPKSLVAFFILSSWLLLLEKKPAYTFLAGVISGVAYLTHDLAVLYIGASFIYLILGRRFKESTYFIAPTIFFALPWLITASLIYHKPSNFIYYPISTGGIPQPSDKVNIVHNFLHTSPLRLLKIRIDNIVYLLSPYQLLSSEGGQIVSNRLWALSLFSIPGALGLGLIIPMFLGLVKKMLSLSGAIFTFIPVLLCALIIGWPKGLGALHFAEAIVVILVGLSVHYLDSLNNKLWLLAAFGINIAQLVYFTAYSYRFAIGEWFKSPQAIATIVGMMLIIGAAGWCMHRLAGDRNNKFLARL